MRGDHVKGSCDAEVEQADKEGSADKANKANLGRILDFVGG